LNCHFQFHHAKYIINYRISIFSSRYLTDQKEINLNVRDKWDSTPLYYACLCGHPEVVSYLLENGARCEANTFDGERCVYGALTDQIRKMLNNFSVISSRVRRYVLMRSWDQTTKQQISNLRIFSTNIYYDFLFNCSI
jgi:ankyrin repeat protein